MYEIWSAEFNYLHQRLGAGVFVLCLHPQCVGRGSRMLMLERLLDHIANADGVAFRTMEDAAAEFRTKEGTGRSGTDRLNEPPDPTLDWEDVKRDLLDQDPGRRG